MYVCLSDYLSEQIRSLLDFCSTPSTMSELLRHEVNLEEIFHSILIIYSGFRVKDQTGIFAIIKQGRLIFVKVNKKQTKKIKINIHIYLANPLSFHRARKQKYRVSFLPHIRNASRSLPLSFIPEFRLRARLNTRLRQIGKDAVNLRFREFH